MKTTVTIRRLSSFTHLKLLLLGGAVFWTLYVVGSFVYLLVAGDLELPYIVGGVEKVTSLGTGMKVFFVLAALVAAIDFLSMFGLWLIATLGLWLYSKFRPISITYFEVDVEPPT